MGEFYYQFEEPGTAEEAFFSLESPDNQPYKVLRVRTNSGSRQYGFDAIKYSEDGVEVFDHVGTDNETELLNLAERLERTLPDLRGIAEGVETYSRYNNERKYA